MDDLDDIAIRKVESGYDAAWNRGDLSRLLSLFEPNAVIINPLGEVAQGRDAIERALGGFLRGPAMGSRHSSTIRAIARVCSNVAVVDGDAHIEGLRDGWSPSLTHPFTDVMVRTEAGWLIAHTRAYVFAESRNTRV